MCPPETTMFNKVKLQLWEKLELEFGKDENTGRYFARVQDFHPDGIVINRPLWHSGEPTFDPNQPFQATIFREDAAYRFNATIIKSFIRDKQNLYVIGYPDELFRHQRRSYCRVDANFAVHFRLLERVHQKEIAYEDCREYFGTTINISASGILINTLKVIKQNDLIAITLNEKGIGITYPIIAVVRRIEDAQDGRINAGIEFLTGDAARKFINPKLEKKLPKVLFRFDERERQRLVQFVFGFQVKLRQKGLI